jgi:flagellar hook-associated protein 2
MPEKTTGAKHPQGGECDMSSGVTSASSGGNLSGISFSGLASGIDSNQIIDQLIQIQRRPITLLQGKQTTLQTQISALQTVNTNLLSVLGQAQTLSKSDAFNVYRASSTDTDVAEVTSSTSASPGSFSLEVTQTAQARSLVSSSFSSSTSVLGYSGDIVINGKGITLSSTMTLEGIRDAINSANAGATAQVLKVGDTDHRLMITASATGEDGLSLADASSSNVLQSLGFQTSTNAIKTSVTGGGAQSDEFTSASTTVSSLLSLNSPQSGTVTIGDKTVSINLGTQSLTDIKNAIQAAAPTGVTATVETTTADDGTSRFSLKIAGTTTFTDSNNVLQTLGVLVGSNVRGTTAQVVTGSTANTTDGTTAITSTTTFGSIFGANVSNGDTIAISGKDHDGNAVSSTFTISNKSTARISDLLSAIETTFGGGATASVSGGKIVLTDDTGGASQLSLTLAPNNQGGGSLSFGTFSTTTTGATDSAETQAGRDATFKINGIQMTRSGNSVGDAVTGVTLDLKQTNSGSPITIGVSRDTGAIKSTIQGFVSSYNTAMSFINQQFSFDTETNTAGGPLAGDATTMALQNRLRDIVTSKVTGLAEGSNALSLFGISFDRTGMLTIDSATLDKNLSTNIDALKKVFIGNGSTSDSDATFVYQSDNTKAGSYSLNLTAAADRGATTGTTDLASGISGSETITLTDAFTGRSQAVSIASGTTIDDIVTQINTALSSTVAEARTGSVANTQASDSAPITASTTFADIAGANVADGDTITISGTDHDGARVSGSYTITNKSTATVGDLLTQLRSIFGGTVSATVDGSGKIVVTDNKTGNSQMTVALIEKNEGGGSLNFGSMDETTQGRYAIGVTASNSGGKLSLTANSYGSKYGFTVSQSANLTGITDGTYSGADVAGTINGEEATGDGQVLTGKSGNASTDGLSVRMTITPSQLASQGASQGTVTVTQGVGDQMRRALKAITDSFNGLVAVRKKAAQDTIKDIQKQIDDMEIRVGRSRQGLVRQFSALESSVATLNSTGSFLGSQLANLSAIGTRR